PSASFAWNHGWSDWHAYVRVYSYAYHLDPVGAGFFFQAEDGIRDRNVTGVQTCALPISSANDGPEPTGSSSTRTTSSTPICSTGRSSCGPARPHELDSGTSTRRWQA